MNLHLRDRGRVYSVSSVISLWRVCWGWPDHRVIVYPKGALLSGVNTRAFKVRWPSAGLGRALPWCRELCQDGASDFGACRPIPYEGAGEQIAKRTPFQLVIFTLA